MTRSLVLNVLSTKTIKIMLVSFVFSIIFAVAMPTPTHAATLTSSQISSILNLLKAFGAEQSVINSVSAALHGESTTGTTSESSSKTSLKLNGSKSKYKVGESVSFKFSIKDAPENAQVEVQAKLVEALAPFTGTIGEINWQSPRVPKGSSNGTRYQTTNSVNKTGVYEVRAFLVACESQGCQSKYNTNVTFGEPSREAYATAKPFKITLTSTTGTTTQSATTTPNDDDDDEDEDEDEDAAPTCSLKANPAKVKAGERVIFTWTSTNATYVENDHFGQGPPSGSITIAPEDSDTYSITAHGPGGEDTCSADVEVEPEDEDTTPTPTVKKPSVTLTASPVVVNSGKKATLTWKSTNATSCTLSYGSTNQTIATAGSMKVTPSASANTFLVNCTNDGGGAASNVVSVHVLYPKPSCTLVASETLVEKGDTITLKWTSKDAVTSSKTGTKNVEKGSIKVKINDQMMFKKTFTGPGGTTTCWSSVNVRGYGTWIREKAIEKTVMAPGSAVLGASIETLSGNQNQALMALVAAFGSSK